MKIGYFADGPWSHKALEKIVADDRFEISFIIPRADTHDSVLEEWAEKLSVDYLRFENVNDPDVIDSLAKYNSDLFISMSFNQILEPQILTVPKKGFINCHAGLLPYYRGRNILNWALINDEKEFGVTVHYVDKGIDTGDIIVQQVEPITDNDNYSTLLDRAIVVCADTLFQAITDIYNGTAQKIQQDTIHPVGFYCGRRTIGDEWIDWNWPSRRIFNFVRAISLPGPCARTVLDNMEISLTNVGLVENSLDYIGTAGEVVGREDGMVFVKTGDSIIRILLADLVSSHEGAALSDLGRELRIGHRFGTNMYAEVQSLRQRISSLEKKISKT